VSSFSLSRISLPRQLMAIKFELTSPPLLFSRSLFLYLLPPPFPHLPLDHTPINHPPGFFNPFLCSCEVRFWTRYRFNCASSQNRNLSYFPVHIALVLSIDPNPVPDRLKSPPDALLTGTRSYFTLGSPRSSLSILSSNCTVRPSNTLPFSPPNSLSFPPFLVAVMLHH